MKKMLMLRRFCRQDTNDPDAKVLFENDYLQVLEKNDYFYVHEKRNIGVGILVYRDGGREILGRFEPNPAHGHDSELCSVTGKVDDSEPVAETAVRELKEETGYICETRHLQELGTTYPYKGADYKLFLFAVDATNLEQQRPEGDGSKHEENSYCSWISLENALRSNDAVLLGLIARFWVGNWS